APPAPLPSFFLTHPATTALSPLSLHDALPICRHRPGGCRRPWRVPPPPRRRRRGCSRRTCHRRGRRRGPSHVPSCPARRRARPRSEEHTSELQSLTNLVCRLLLEKKKHTPAAY